MKPTTLDAYRLLQDGAMALAQVESNGIRVDVSYLERVSGEVGETISTLNKELRSHDVYRTWKRAFGDKANVGSREQLATVLFDRLGFQKPAYTEKSKDEEKKRYKTDKSVLEGLDHPFVRTFLRVEKLKKLKSTYIQGILREVVDGYIHPFFNLHVVDTFRSSCDSPNVQNVPVRDTESHEIIRRGIIPRKNRLLAEVDFSGIEVKAAAWYTKDPALLAYIADPTTDMHRDTAVDLFLLSSDFLKKHKDWAKKTVRDWAKNRFVFPEFYGSAYFQCAPHIWEEVVKEGNCLPESGVSIREHLKSKGITSLGNCEPGKQPSPGTFSYHVKKVEDSFWNERFTVYARWKKKWVEDYRRTGVLRMLTGFCSSGELRRNQIVNYGFQGSAFHCLLWSLVQIQNELNRRKMKTKIIGQIHDSIIADVVRSEVQEFLSLCHEVMTERLRRHWKFIITPMETESELSETSWFEKKQWLCKDGVWGPK